MADGTADLIEFIEKNRPSGPFKPYAYYGAEEDALIFYFRGDPDYARRLNRRVTVFLSLEGNELIGCQIKGVRSVLEDIPWFDVEITHKGARLKMLFLAYLGTLADDPEARRVYRELGRLPSDIIPDVEIPELV